MVTLDIPQTIESASKGANILVQTERGTYMLSLVLILLALVWVSWFSLIKLSDITKEFNDSITKQRQEFLEAQKIRDALFTEAIYGIRQK